MTSGKLPTSLRVGRGRRLIATGSRTFPATATGTCTMTGADAGVEPANDHNDVST